MKLCDECGKNAANIHLTQITQNETQVSHLCEECARKKGVSISISEDLLPLDEEQSLIEDSRQCPSCKLSLSTFKTKGWLGCAKCYQAFEKELDELLLQMHGSLVHKGKQYRDKPESRAALTGEMKKLRSELAAAIKSEKFEQAATLRDAIHSIKQMGYK